MKIKLIKEGGFVGIPCNKSLDLESLSEEEQAAFHTALEETLSKEKNAPAKKGKKEDDTVGTRSLGIPADVQSYEIKVKKGNKTVTIKYDDTNIPENIYLMFEKYV